MLHRSRFTTAVDEPYGMRMGGARALDPIDARDGFSKANPETFGPRALDSKKATLAQNAAAARAAAAQRTAETSAAPAVVLVDPSTLPLTDPARAKSSLPYVALAVLVTFLAARFLAR